jgi:hypothetical protein
VVRLDRTVSGRTPFIMRYTGQIPESQDLAIYGHPGLLPIKLTRSAWVQRNEFDERFYANGDIFAGNSGGPVLNLTTNVVEGVTVTQPPPRFAMSSDALGACSRYRVCADTGCTSPDVVKQLTGAMRTTRVPGVPLHAALVHAVL